MSSSAGSTSSEATEKLVDGVSTAIQLGVKSRPEAPGLQEQLESLELNDPLRDWLLYQNNVWDSVQGPMGLHVSPASEAADKLVSVENRPPESASRLLPERSQGDSTAPCATMSPVVQRSSTEQGDRKPLKPLSSASIEDAVCEPAPSRISLHADLQHELRTA